MKKHSRTSIGSAIAIAVGALHIIPAAAQEAQAESGGDAILDSAVVDDIIVTAQKRSESVMKVPISVNVMGGEELRNRGIVSLAEVAASLPAFKMAEATVGNKIYIRGIGSGQNLSFEQSVGTFVDGVYRGRSKLSQAAMFDLERVEVLKGPQSTYFGNNTIAGAISITTRNPGNEREISGEALYSPAHGERSIEGIVSGPLSDTLKARVALKYYGIDGWVRNTFTGRTAPREKTFAGRGTIIWEPTADFQAALKAEIARSNNEGGAMFQMTRCPPDPTLFPQGPKGPCALALATGPGFEGNFDNRYSSSPGQKGFLDSDLISLTLNHSLGAHTLTSVTSYSHHNSYLPIDADQSGANYLNNAVGDAYTQVSQELRLASPADGAITYIVGGYYHHGEINGRIFLWNFLNSPNSGAKRTFDQDEDVFSPFATLTWSPTPSLSITPGLRWTSVSKRAHRVTQTAQANSVGWDFSDDNLTILTTPLDRVDRRSDSDFTPSLKIQFKPSNRAMFYASYARGFKAGGLDALPPQNTVSDFGPEKVNAFEVGAKVSGFDNRLRLSAALFWSNFSGLQQSVYSTPSDPTKVGLFTTQNVGKAVSRGLELDGSFAITSELKFAAALTILDAYFENFSNGPCSTAYAATHPGCITRDFEGLKQPFAPDYSGSVSINYERAVFSHLQFTASASLNFTSGYYTETKLDPFSYQKAYRKVDARIGIGEREGRWHLAVIGKNLTNKYTTQWASDTSLATGTYFRTLDRTRSVAVQLGFKY